MREHENGITDRQRRKREWSERDRKKKGRERIEREKESKYYIEQRWNLRVARTNDHRTIAVEFPLVANLSGCGMVEPGSGWHSATTR